MKLQKHIQAVFGREAQKPIRPPSQALARAVARLLRRAHNVHIRACHESHATTRTLIVTSGLILIIAALTTGCSHPQSQSQTSTQARPPASAPFRGNETSITAVRFLEDRVRGDPDDIVALNKLSAYYQQLYRETNDVTYLSLALRASQRSLKVLGPDQNLSGVIALAQAEYSTHDFVAARDHARQIAEWQPEKPVGYQVLGDSLLELGEYDAAYQAYDKIAQLDPGSVATETRLGRRELLGGNFILAQQHFRAALEEAKHSVPSSNETIAWCYWQLGETAFQSGDYRTAEQQFGEALSTYPNYVRALAGLGKARAARGNVKSAIEEYEHAVKIIPDPQFLAALGDLYKITGRDSDANIRYAQVERIDKLNQLNGTVYSRQLALFFADHDLKADEAHVAAAREYALRRDIYGADAVAWAALKAGRTAESLAAIHEALKLGTNDARIFYHAGMIARAAGDEAKGREYLQRALKLSPNFDPLQAAIARQALGK